MFCSKCGYENQEGAKFCVKCGTVLVEEKKEEQSSTQNAMVQFGEISQPNKNNKKKTAIILIVLIAVIVGFFAIEQAGVFYKCYDCGKWITAFSSNFREDGEDCSVAVCENCYNNVTNNSDASSLKGGYELDDVITAVINMVCTNDINRISTYTHPYAETFREYCYSNYSEDESVYVDCHMEVKNSIKKLNAKDIYFIEDTTCVLDQIYYSFEEISSVISEFESFLAGEGISESIEDFAFVEFDVDNSECSINLGVIMVQTKTGWYLLAIDT